MLEPFKKATYSLLEDGIGIYFFFLSFLLVFLLVHIRSIFSVILVCPSAITFSRSFLDYVSLCIVCCFKD